MKTEMEELMEKIEMLNEEERIKLVVYLAQLKEDQQSRRKVQ